MPWTEAMDARLKGLAHEGLSTYDAAEKMGVSRSALISRAKRTGVKFHRHGSNSEPGHRAFTPRCAELIQQARENRHE